MYAGATKKKKTHSNLQLNKYVNVPRVMVSAQLVLKLRLLY